MRKQKYTYNNIHIAFTLHIEGTKKNIDPFYFVF